MAKLLAILVNVICALFLVDATTIVPGNAVHPLVTIPEGKLEGKEEVSRDGRKFFAFRGIPYGKAERWNHSVPAENWEGRKVVSEFGATCLQFDVLTNKIHGEEDCLFLNVYSPKILNGTALPVMAFFHGGGFRSGSSNEYGPKYFMDEDVVLVTINYRVGPFGFTDTGFDSNFGLKDQILALQWVNKNIQHFGGDQNSVTIFGESAGAISVSVQTLSPLSKGLFHKAISQSGTATNPLIPFEEKPKEFQKLGRLMGCPSKTNAEELLTCLTKIDGLSIISTLTKSEATPGFKIQEIPNIVIKVEKDQKDAFLPDFPVNILKKGDFEKIPWITGTNENEGAVAVGASPEFKAIYKNGGDKENWNSIAPKAFRYDEKNTNRSEAIHQFYFGNNEKTSEKENIVNLLSDYGFIHPAKSSAVIYSKHASTYLYHFSLRGVASFYKHIIPPGPDGLYTPTHGDELQYLFNTPLFPEIQSNSNFSEFSDHFVKLWTTFAKNGNFATSDNNAGNGTVWTPLSDSIGPNDDIQWYLFDTESKMAAESTILGSRMKFWDNLDNNV